MIHQPSGGAKGQATDIQIAAQNIQRTKNKLNELLAANTGRTLEEVLSLIHIYMRYGDDNSGYFWIDDTNYNLVMHPILSEQEGTNRKDLEDKNGVKIIQEIMKVADNGGYNEFYFTKSDGKTVAPKVAYSLSFPEWNWVITLSLIHI